MIKRKKLNARMYCFGCDLSIAETACSDMIRWGRMTMGGVVVLAYQG